MGPLSLSSASTTSFLRLPIREYYLFGGGRMCFPVRDSRCPSSIALHMSSFLARLVSRSLCLFWRPDVFSWPRLRTASSPLLHSSILLLPTCSTRASMLWTVTVFGFGGLSRTGLCGLVATHHGVYPLRVVSWRIPSHKKGEERSQIPAES